jgi:hypothetical protein
MGEILLNIFEISKTGHPELVSGSHAKGENEMLNPVQHDTSC